MKLQRLLVLSLAFVLLGQFMPARSRAASTSVLQGTQGYSVSVTDTCTETIAITRVTLSVVSGGTTTDLADMQLNPPRSVRSGETASFTFQNISRTPNQVRISWTRGLLEVASIFSGLTVGSSQDQACLRVLLTSIFTADAAMLFSQTGGLVASAAAQLGLSVDTSQAKVFQLGGAPMAVAPTTTFDFDALGPVGIASLGGSLTIGGSVVPSGNYRLEFRRNSSTGRIELLFRDQFGSVKAVVPASETRVIQRPDVSQLTDRSGRVGTGSDRPDESTNVAAVPGPGCFGPTLDPSVLSSTSSPFFRVVMCIGFVCPVSQGVFLSTSFCTD